MKIDQVVSVGPIPLTDGFCPEGERRSPLQSVNACFQSSARFLVVPRPPLDQHEMGMVNASLDVAGDSDEPPLGIQNFQ